MSEKGRLILSGGLLCGGIVFRLMNGYEYLGYGLMAVALAVLYYLILGKIRDKHPKIERILNKIMSYFIVLFCLVFAITEGAIYYGSSASEPRKTDYVIVLGSSVREGSPSKTLLYRLETALEYMNENPETVCIAAGYQGPREPISEAECMANWLTDNGIDADRIIKEDRSSRTRENIEYSAEIIRERTGAWPETVTIITSDYHTLRAAMLARDYNITPVSVPAATRLPLLRVACYIREALAVWKYYIFG